MDNAEIRGIRAKTQANVINYRRWYSGQINALLVYPAKDFPDQ